jgi:transcription factor S
MFCKECGAFLMPTQEDGKTVFKCSCGYSSATGTTTLTESGKKTQKVEVVGGEEPNVHPVVDERCTKCGNDKAWHWSIQMRGADEAETRFFKCTTCEYTWREK